MDKIDSGPVHKNGARVKSRARSAFFAAGYDSRAQETTERERQLADVVESSPDAIYSTDSRHMLTSWNSGAKNIYGWSAAEIIGRPGWTIIPKDRLAEMRQIWAVLRAGENIRQHETLRLRKDGSPIEISLSAWPVLDRRGRFAGISMVARDISRRKRMEQRLRQQTEELARIMEVVPAVVWVANDPECREVYGNDFASKLFHLESYTNVSATPPSGGRPFPIRCFRRGRLLKTHELPMQRAATTGKPQPVEELDFELPDGRTLTLLGSATPLFDERQKVRGVVAVFSDITARKKSQDLLRHANEMLEVKVRERTAQLLQLNAKLRREVTIRRNLQNQIMDISEREQRRIGQDIHDGLGQQLTGIAMLADALQDKLRSKKLDEAEDSRRVLLLLQQARSQTRRLSHGLQPVPPDPDGLMISLKELAESVTNLGVDCRFQCPVPIHLSDNLKATHLFRIAQEAVGNALRHAQCQKIRLSLSTSKGSLRLEIRNDGRKFLLRQKRKSRGMGLQLMKFRSEAMGGALHVNPLSPGGALIACIVPVTGKS
ncbi:MAG TPA: PAS domain S-box protein [Verrucomicrobiae bacterium]|nr:PAS domain S-box protein [Verrucomicrobiae bacterium]